MRSKWDAYLATLEEEHHMVEKRLCSAVKAITAEPWFERICIVQEVFNAREGVVYCGGKLSPAWAFGMCSGFIASLDKNLVMPAALPFLNAMSGFHEELRSQDLHGLIRTFVSSKASDQRDRIYALLSIATDITDGTSLVRDYTITESETIANTIRHLFGWSISDYSPHSKTDHSLIEAFFRDITIGGPCRLLEHALEIGHGHAFKIMLDKGFELGYKELWRWADGDLLFLAAKKGQEDIVRMLLDLRPPDIDPDQRRDGSFAPLRAAAKKGHTAIVKMLMSHDPTVTHVDSSYETELDVAAKNGHTSTVRVLLASGRYDAASHKALHWAAEHGLRSTGIPRLWRRLCLMLQRKQTLSVIMSRH